jgi:hypothetical protein
MNALTVVGVRLMRKGNRDVDWSVVSQDQSCSVGADMWLGGESEHADTKIKFFNN